ncbi:hypothetical protein GIB67_000028 [Kingdonia uniflora]|uniref:C-CAP/cofactor C-like domain-containing protein n=1 Tax=Kingdonia uniflora TaxID=39325 RepID=A0A7J7MNU6_9MAGN|nr:hypothetical protein GIB67_000028 [Kingdonia uniflora]
MASTKASIQLDVIEMRDYVKSLYPLGPVWSLTGKTNVSAPARASSKVPPPGAPAPPPTSAGSLFSSDCSKAPASRPKAGMVAAFQGISSGETVTAGLRKVTDDMKSKNRTDKTGIVAASGKETRTGSSSFSKTRPPKLELQMGRKWGVENQIGRKNLVIDDYDSKQSVYVFGCKDSILQIQGKVNNITIDKCMKMAVVFMNVVAACEIVNCNGVEVQCQGSAPTILVDNTTGCQLYLSKDSLETSITTAKSSEINVSVPGAEASDDWIWTSLFYIIDEEVKRNAESMDILVIKKSHSLCLQAQKLYIEYISGEQTQSRKVLDVKASGGMNGFIRPLPEVSQLTQSGFCLKRMNGCSHK